MLSKALVTKCIKIFFLTETLKKVKSFEYFGNIILKQSLKKDMVLSIFQWV